MTPVQATRARELRAKGLTFGQIALRVGCQPYEARNAVHHELQKQERAARRSEADSRRLERQRHVLSLNEQQLLANGRCACGLLLPCEDCPAAKRAEDFLTQARDGED